MLGLVLPLGMEMDEVKEFSEYFEAIGDFLKQRNIDIFGDEVISKAIMYFGVHLTTKLVKHMRAGNLDAGVSEILDIVNEIVYVESVRKYVEDRYQINLQSNLYTQALLSDLTAWHGEMLILAKYQRPYEEAYRATVSMVKEYWIHQPAQGRA